MGQDRWVSDLIMGTSQIVPRLFSAAWTLVWGRMLSSVRDAREPPETVSWIQPICGGGRGGMEGAGYLLGVLFQTHWAEVRDLQPQQRWGKRPGSHRGHHPEWQLDHNLWSNIARVQRIEPQEIHCTMRHPGLCRDPPPRLKLLEFSGWKPL